MIARDQLEKHLAWPDDPSRLPARTERWIIRPIEGWDRAELTKLFLDRLATVDEVDWTRSHKLMILLDLAVLSLFAVGVYAASHQRGL